MEIQKEFSFEAAHRLPLVSDDHKCRTLHGHSYRVIVRVSGDVSRQTGWVMDFARIKEAMQPVLAVLDHSYLNEVPGLENPTVENVAMWIWDRLHSSLPQISGIDVFETPGVGCSYRAK